MIYPKYYLLDFCNGELMEQESFKTKEELKKYIKRTELEDTLIILGYEVTEEFI